MEAKTQAEATKQLFESLTHLYVQARQLLVDCDRPMGERGWEPIGSYALQDIIVTAHSPKKWFARWAARFYLAQTGSEQDETVKALRFVSLHFCSDEDTQVVEPLVIAGIYVIANPLKRQKVKDTNKYHWICKSWFYALPEHGKKLCEWYDWVPGAREREGLPEGKIASFAVPLYDIKSSKELEKMVIDALFSK